MPIEQSERDRWAAWTYMRAGAATSAPRAPQPPLLLLDDRVMMDSGANLLAIDSDVAANCPLPGETQAGLQDGSRPAPHSAPQQQELVPPLLASDSDDESYSPNEHEYWEEDDAYASLSANGGDYAEGNVADFF